MVRRSWIDTCTVPVSDLCKLRYGGVRMRTESGEGMVLTPFQVSELRARGLLDVE